MSEYTQELRDRLTDINDLNMFDAYLAELYFMSDRVASIAQVDWQTLYKLVYEMYIDVLVESETGKWYIGLPEEEQKRLNETKENFRRGYMSSGANKYKPNLNRV